MGRQRWAGLAALAGLMMLAAGAAVLRPSAPDTSALPPTAAPARIAAFLARPPSATGQMIAAVRGAAAAPTAVRTPARQAEPGSQTAAAETPIRIQITAIALDAPVEPVSLARAPGKKTAEWGVPDGRAAGWHDTSARLGEPGNLVLNGHHNIKGLVFARLKDLKLLDQVVLRGPTRAVTYTVVERLLLREANQPLKVRVEHAKYIAPTTDTRLTLVTCWPPSSYTHRLILIARPVGENQLEGILIR